MRDLLSRIRVFAAQRDLSQAKHLYSLLQQNRYCLDKLTTNQLMRMFGKCGSVEDARKLFDQIDNPDTVQWNIIVTAYAQNGHFQNAKSMFDSSPQRDMVSWNTMCQSFSWSHKVDEVSQCLQKMPQHNVVSWNSLLCTFAQNGHYPKAQALFVAMPEKDVISWNIVISQYAEIDLDRAKLLFDRAPQHSVVTWNVLIAHHCEESKRVFDAMPCRDIVSWNSLLDVDQDQEIFSKMPSHDAISWITVIAANAREGHLDCAMDLFDRSPSRSLALWNVILSGFASSGDVNRARSILSSMPRTDVISWNSLLAGLLEFSSLRDAGELFAAMPHRNLSSWTLLVGGYAQHCETPRQAAAILLESMPQWDLVPWNAVLSAMARAGDAAGAKDLFDRMPDHRNAVSWIILCELGCSMIPFEAFDKMPEHGTAAVLAVVAAYARCLRWDTARYLFETLRHRTLVAWNAYLALCVAQSALARPAAVLGRMPQWSAVSWSSIVAASGKNSKLGMDPDEEEARLLIEMTAAAAIESSSPSPEPRSIALATTLLVAHALNGDTASAKSVFDDTTRRDVVAWTAMVTASSMGKDPDHAAAVHRRMPAIIAGLAHNGLPRLAIDLFENEMDLPPNEVTLTTLLDACAELGDLALGIALHKRCAELDLDRHSVVATALLDMYSRCGRVDQAKRVFNSMRARDERVDLVTWNAMIAGFARSGHSIEALELYRELEKLDRELQPDASTFAAVIDACASAVPPAVSEGRAIHRQAIARGMDDDPVVGSSLVAMYTRIGGLDAAQRCFDRITARNTVAWNSMLVGFANHGSATGVIQSFHAMQLDGAIADAVTFVAVLSSCSHAGWIVEAGQCFQSMAADFFIAATPEHYSAIGDLLARLGQIGEARSLIRAKPYESSAADWMSLLSACRIHCNVEHGASAAAQAFEFGELDDPIAAASGTCKLLLGIFSAL
ncbi:pentatricopeptide repeat-containing protein At4g02750 [Selaginella moellendorffii]|uniref:pentatricopeptide repeat-containing protein At4g02750 n=1 Tax=Selaginella moellendorffii TaxID=88036 RepID=UPI000D1D0AA5|nr:pentatricopeptide repeat-containing protein At4g02750 [Selaginella moellendorffii]|eukprot:XP_024529093.1 pentatricopeptide repeat-containing protein At4g02750 [Selaginella moellendorffii]